MSPDKNQNQTSLDAKFAGGLAWTAGAKWATQFLTWGATVAVARILFPADVGIAEIAGIFTNITNVLAEFGIGTAVLHMPELERKTLGQLHMFSILLCTGIFVLAALGSPLLALFFRSDHVLFFVANNIAFLITGIQAVPFGLLQRDMDYRRLSLVEALMVSVQAVVTVLAALAGWKFWSLWAGGLAGKIAATALICYWKPLSFAWPRWADIRKPVEMGRHVAISRVTSAACGMADAIIVGRFLGESALGTYRMAMNLASAPAEKISTLLMRTASPLFANVMDDVPLVRRYYLIISELLSLVVMPLMVGLVIVAPQAVPVLLGARWAAATAPLQWLGLFMIVRVLGVLAEQVLVSQRLTRFTMRISIMNFVVMLLAFIVAARWKGTGGVAAAWIVLSPLTVLPLLIVLARSIQLPFRDYAAALLPAVAGSAIMCLALFGISGRLFSTAWPVQLRLALQVAAGGVVYVVFILTLFRGRVVRYTNFLSNLRKKREIPVSAVS
ncbi:MAG: lipopolysaccharide biosynthesis protein [Bryobacteraceae bacterium]